MPQFKPKTRGKSDEILNHALEGELAIYEKVGLFTRAGQAIQIPDLTKASVG